MSQASVAVDARRPEPVPRPQPRPPLPWTVLAAISAGGGLGGLARFGLAAAFPAPWATLLVNVSGCFLIGVLMVLLTWTGRPLLRPFLGVGVLGGFTTFSFHAMEAYDLLTGPAIGPAVAYLTGMAAAALGAVYAGTQLTRWMLRWRSRAAAA